MLWCKCYTNCKCYVLKLSDSGARFFPKTMFWSEKFYLDVMAGTTAKEQTTILQISTKYDPYFN